MVVVYVRICVDISRQYIILPVEINLSFSLLATHFEALRRRHGVF